MSTAGWCRCCSPKPSPSPARREDASKNGQFNPEVHAERLVRPPVRVDWSQPGCWEILRLFKETEIATSRGTRSPLPPDALPSGLQPLPAWPSSASHCSKSRTRSGRFGAVERPFERFASTLREVLFSADRPACPAEPGTARSLFRESLERQRA